MTKDGASLTIYDISLVVDAVSMVIDGASLAMDGSSLTIDESSLGIYGVVKPATAWIGSNPVPLFINNCAVVILALTNNVDIYATPVPGIPVVQAALNTLTTDQAATADGGNSTYIKRDNSRLVVANLMRQLAAYVTVACKGDITTSSSAVFRRRRPRARRWAFCRHRRGWCSNKVR